MSDERNELIARLRAVKNDWETTPCYNGTRLEAAALLERDGEKIADMVRWQEDAVRNCARRQCGRREARIAELEAAIKRQASAALTLADATKAISGHDLETAQKLRAESQPGLIESERAANARLTAELDEARAALAEAQKDAKRYRRLINAGSENNTLSNLLSHAIAALAAIDAELGLPEDGCNSTAQTLTAIRLLHSAHRDDVTEIERLGRELAEARRTAEYWKAEHLAGNAMIERLERERDTEERDCCIVMDERDRATDVIGDVHRILGGDGEWCGRLPPQDPPDSGDLHLDLPVLAEDVMRQLAAARAEAEALRTALAMMYDKWVDGDDCYEEPDTFSGFLGKAFQLSITEEDHVISLIGKDCPTRAIDAAIAREGM